jgi:hypothetical protein
VEGEVTNTLNQDLEIIGATSVAFSGMELRSYVSEDGTHFHSYADVHAGADL